MARRTLTLDETLAEARTLAARGFHHLLLVTGEHPKAASLASLCEAVAALRAAGVASVSVEIAPLDVGGYRALALAGADGLVVYQETYDRETYGRVHLGGPKRDYDWRLAAPERGARAGMRRLGIGALSGSPTGARRRSRSSRTRASCCATRGAARSPSASRGFAPPPATTHPRIP